jgi:hypothetical protein
MHHPQAQTLPPGFEAGAAQNFAALRRPHLAAHRKARD